MEDYSKVLSLDDVKPELTLYNRGDVDANVVDTSYDDVKKSNVVETEGASYTFDYLAENTFKNTVDYSKVPYKDPVVPTEANYEKKKKIKLERSEKDYHKVKDVDTTKVIDFNEEDERFDRLTSKAVKKYSDIKDDAVKPIEVLQSSEPDFMSNMYNIYLLEVPAEYRDNPELAYKMGTTLGTYIGPETDTGRDYLSTPTNDLFSIIGMRTEGIEIPNKSMKPKRIFSSQKLLIETL